MWRREWRYCTQFYKRINKKIANKGVGVGFILFNQFNLTIKRTRMRKIREVKSGMDVLWNEGRINKGERVAGFVLRMRKTPKEKEIKA